MTSSTNFTQPTTFGRRHHSFPYNILCAFLWRLHPNVTFPRTLKWESQNWDFSCPKTLDTHIFLKSNLKVQGQYFIALENIFPTLYNMFQSDLIWPLLSKICGQNQISNLICSFFYHNSCQSSLNEQCEGIWNIYASRPF